MKKLLTILLITMFLSSCEIKHKPIKEDPNHYYLVEVKYTDNTKDTFDFNMKYEEFYLKVQSQDFSSGKIVCFYSHWNKVACDVKTFKILKDSIL